LLLSAVTGSYAICASNLTSKAQISQWIAITEDITASFANNNLVKFL
jgi:hypothetical protein